MSAQRRQTQLGLTGAAQLAAVCVRRGGWKPALHEWVRERSARREDIDLSISLLGRTLLLVNDPDLSAAVLAPPPRTDRVAVTPARRRSMAFLAPRALTISNDGEWARRREWNERVLATGRPHDERAAHLAATLAAFAEPIGSVEAIREAMGRLMLGVVFGAGAPADLPGQVRTLMGLVGSPSRRILAGPLHVGRRARLYEAIHRQWDRATDRSLVGRFRDLGAGPSDEAMEQVPHWMFTFVLSGTELLTRSLAMIGSRPGALARVREEVAAAEPLEDPGAIARLPYVEACVREAGRLFAPVPMTSHSAPRGADLAGRRIAPGTRMVQFLPLMQRNTARDPTADDFVPERWLDPASGAAERYPNLFLSGARQCPGRDLIMFVCASAIAIQVGRHGVRVEAPALARDPLPLEFPSGGLRVHRPRTDEEGGVMAQTRAATSYDELLRMNQAALDALYRDVGEPGATPVGDTRGSALVLPGTAVGGLLRRAARLFWQGKVFDPSRGTLLNKVTPLGIRAIRARVDVGDSWLDRGTQATVLDYSRTSLVARWIRDEIREVGPGLWLGKVYVRRWHALDFTLRSP